MYAAARLQDRGYDVIVFETRAFIGGHCNTARFSPPAGAPPGSPGWLDWGVQLYPDTKFAQSQGIGTWSVDTVAFVKRFAGNSSVLPVNFADLSGAEQTYYVNIAKKKLETPAGVSASDYQAAFVRYETFLAQYPWLTTYNYPAVIPAALLVPFSQTIATLNLYPMASLFEGFLTSGGVGDLSKVTTLAAVSQFTQLVTFIITTTGGGFTVYNGCASIYEGITAYLGSANVVTNFTTSYVIRPSGLLGQIFSNVVAGYNSYTQKGSIYTCDKIISAFPQTIDNFAGWDLDPTETGIFQHVSWRAYYNGLVTVTGGTVATLQTGFQTLNYDPTGFVGTPQFPSLTNVLRPLPYGPAGLEASAETQNYTVADITPIVNAGLAAIASTGVLTATLQFVTLHQFQPHPDTASLHAQPNFYTRLYALQGHRDTYYTASLVTTAGSFAVWNQAEQLVTSTAFPVKP